LYLYSIKIQTNIDQNAVKYLRKITDFFENIFDFFFRLGPVGLAGSLAQTSDPTEFIPTSVRE